MITTELGQTLAHSKEQHDGAAGPQDRLAAAITDLADAFAGAPPFEIQIGTRPKRMGIRHLRLMLLGLEKMFPVAANTHTVAELPVCIVVEGMMLFHIARVRFSPDLGYFIIDAEGLDRTSH